MVAEVNVPAVDSSHGAILTPNIPSVEVEHSCGLVVQCHLVTMEIPRPFIISACVTTQEFLFPGELQWIPFTSTHPWFLICKGTQRSTALKNCCLKIRLSYQYKILAAGPDKQKNVLDLTV